MILRSSFEVRHADPHTHKHFETYTYTYIYIYLFTHIYIHIRTHKKHTPRHPQRHRDKHTPKNDQLRDGILEGFLWRAGVAGAACDKWLLQVGVQEIFEGWPLLPEEKAARQEETAGHAARSQHWPRGTEIHDWDDEYAGGRRDHRGGGCYPQVYVLGGPESATAAHARVHLFIDPCILACVFSQLQFMRCAWVHVYDCVHVHTYVGMHACVYASMYGCMYRYISKDRMY